MCRYFAALHFLKNLWAIQGFDRVIFLMVMQVEELLRLSIVIVGFHLDILELVGSFYKCLTFASTITPTSYQNPMSKTKSWYFWPSWNMLICSMIRFCFLYSRDSTLPWNISNIRVTIISYQYTEFRFQNIIFLIKLYPYMIQMFFL